MATAKESAALAEVVVVEMLVGQQVLVTSATGQLCSSCSAFVPPLFGHTTIERNRQALLAAPNIDICRQNTFVPTSMAQEATIMDLAATARP